MFKKLAWLSPIDHTLMLQSDYSNDEINKCFDLWNKKYGNNIHFDENDDTDRNNLGEVSKEVMNDLMAIEPNPDKILDSLVLFLYSTPSTRKKKLLWYVFGDRLFSRLQSKLDNKQYCTKCGRRSNKTINGWCEQCVMSSGQKPVTCKTCGQDFLVPPNDNRTRYCFDCRKEYRNNYMKSLMKTKAQVLAEQN